MAYFGPGQISAQNNPRPGQDRCYTGNFSPLKDIKITQDQAKFSSKNRLDLGKF